MPTILHFSSAYNSASLISVTVYLISLAKERKQPASQHTVFP